MAVWSILKKLYDLINAAGTGVPTVLPYNNYAAANKTPVVQSASAENTTTTIHTVTTGKTFYLCSVSLSALNAKTDANLLADISTNETGYDWFCDVQLGNAIAGQTLPNGHVFISYPMPIKISAGKLITVSSNTASGYAYACITGWEE